MVISQPWWNIFIVQVYYIDMTILWEHTQRGICTIHHWNDIYDVYMQIVYKGIKMFMKCDAWRLRDTDSLSASLSPVNTLRPKENGRHFADDIFKGIFLNENISFPIRFSLKFIPKGSINNIPALVRVWLGADQATSHYLDQWWLINWRIYASLGLNELTTCMKDK